jgi:hypothetical protein
MNNEILFTETQRFKQWWIWLILVAANVLAMLSSVKAVLDEERFPAQPGTIALFILTITTLLFTILFANSRLETTIRKEGVYVRFFPFHSKFKYYSWDSITRSYVRQYAPLSEYGGWGLRFAIFGKGTAFNVSGNKGLQLEFKNRRKLLIGTAKPDAVAETLRNFGQLKS